MRLLAAAVLSGASFATLAQPVVTLTHVHGLAWSNDGKRLAEGQAR